MSFKEAWLNKTANMVDEEIDDEINKYKTYSKRLGNSIIINKWLDGSLITKEQLEYIKHDQRFDSSSVKKMVIKVPQFSKDGLKTFLGLKPEDRFYNKQVKRVNRAMVNGRLDDGSTFNVNLLTAKNTSELKFGQGELHSVRSDLCGLQGAKAHRKAEKLEELRVKKNIQAMSLSEIYQRAVNAKKLEVADMQAHEEEEKPVEEKPVEEKPVEEKPVEEKQS